MEHCNVDFEVNVPPVFMVSNFFIFIAMVVAVEGDENCYGKDGMDNNAPSHSH